MTTSKYQSLISHAVRFWFADCEIKENYRPAWLGGMELDFYIPACQIAIEAQGEQHYHFVKKFHHSPDDLQSQKRRDSYKRKLSHAQGITVLCFRDFKDMYTKLRNTLPNRTFPTLPADLRLAMKQYRLDLAFFRGQIKNRRKRLKPSRQPA